MRSTLIRRPKPQWHAHKTIPANMDNLQLIKRHRYPFNHRYLSPKAVRFHLHHLRAINISKSMGWTSFPLKTALPNHQTFHLKRTRCSQRHHPTHNILVWQHRHRHRNNSLSRGRSLSIQLRERLVLDIPFHALKLTSPDNITDLRPSAPRFVRGGRHRFSVSRRGNCEESEGAAATQIRLVHPIPHRTIANKRACRFRSRVGIESQHPHPVGAMGY